MRVHSTVLSSSPGSVWPADTRHRAQTMAMLAARLQTSLERTHSTPLLPPAIHPQPISSNFPVLGGASPREKRQTHMLVFTNRQLFVGAGSDWTGPPGDTRKEALQSRPGQTTARGPYVACWAF